MQNSDVDGNNERIKYHASGELAASPEQSGIFSRAAHYYGQSCPMIGTLENIEMQGLAQSIITVTYPNCNLFSTRLSVTRTFPPLKLTGVPCLFDTAFSHRSIFHSHSYL
jgi:hypothetical protein